MKAMVLNSLGSPLVLEEREIPVPKEKEILVQVHLTGLCRTDLHIVDNELPHPKLPLILGHEVVGIVKELGPNVTRFQKGDRVGIPWLYQSCDICAYCLSGQENLCDQALFTGYTRNGGFAEYTLANSDYAFPLPSHLSDRTVAPLLCAGMIGWRALKMCEGAQKIGFYGFGTSAHLLAQVVRYRGGQVFAFTRRGDKEGQAFAKKVGAHWAGGSDEYSPELLEAAIIFAPVGALIPQALKNLKKGGIVVLAGIHMSDIPSFPYSLLWGERVIRSVANLTRKDGDEFLKIAATLPLKVETTLYPLEKLNDALSDMRQGRTVGAIVIEVANSEDKSSMR